MNEAQIRERLRQAVGESRYPTYLSGRVGARLKDHGRRPSPWLTGIRRTGSLVAVVLVVLLIAVLVVGVHLWRTGGPVPAGQNPAIQQYQAMLSANDQKEHALGGFSCYKVADTACLAMANSWHNADQLWLDDLDSSHPPARFAALDALMRRHLTIGVSYDITMATAYKTHDQEGFDLAAAAETAEIDATSRQAEDIIASRQATTATYTGEVRLDNSYLVACALCQQLLNQTQASCPASQTPSCSDEIAAIRVQVEILQEDLVRYYAPPSFTDRDQRLQADLQAVDAELDAMTSALAAGDQVSLQAKLDDLQHGLARVASDSTDIAGSA